jgi:hypothetical protein
MLKVTNDDCDLPSTGYLLGLSARQKVFLLQAREQILECRAYAVDDEERALYNHEIIVVTSSKVFDVCVCARMYIG